MGAVSIRRVPAKTLFIEPSNFDPSWWDPFPMWSDPAQDLAGLDLLTRFSPKFDIRETSDRLIVRADVPGVREQDLEVMLTDCSLVIKGSRQLEGDEGVGTSYSAERAAGAFTRTVLLPHRIRPEQGLAELLDGVLHVVLPRAQDAQ